MLKAVHVGVDISGERNVAQFLDQDGNLLRKPFSFSNDSPGLSSFVEVLRDVADSHKPEVMNIGMEATGFYWWHLEERLSEDGFLDVETRVFVINPSLIKAFKKAYTSLPKTDAVDAWVIADKLRFGRLTPVSEKGLIYAPLARLTRLRYHLKRSINQTLSPRLHDEPLPTGKPADRCCREAWIGCLTSTTRFAAGPPRACHMAEDLP